MALLNATLALLEAGLACAIAAAGSNPRNSTKTKSFLIGTILQTAYASLQMPARPGQADAPKYCFQAYERIALWTYG